MAGFGPKDDKKGNALYPGFNNTTPPGFSRIGRLEEGSQRLQRGQLRPVQGTYQRLPKQVLHTNVNSSQVIDVSKVYVRKIGGIPPAGNTAGFAYTATTTSITWYWDGTNGSLVPVITRADGSRFTIPTTGSGLTVTGLGPGITYYFLPFWNINSLSNVGWVQGTIGSPQIAFVLADTTDAVNTPIYLMQQTLQGNEALSGAWMTAATPAVGTGGGGAGGGGLPQHGCVMEGTDIQPVGGMEYKIEILPETEWVHLRTEDNHELYCTYDHPLYHAINGKTRADFLTPGEWVITDKGEQRLVTADFVKKPGAKHKVIMPKGHLFWSNGFLSHNVKYGGGP